ncbi:MAG: hypothetical protein ACLQU1_41120 [Bryobacteraceae bacterium]
MAADDSIRWHPSRRAFFITGVAALSRLKAMPATPDCTLMAEQEAGPYYLDDQTLRQNITEGKPGLPLKLRIAMVDARRCSPLPSAAVDIWQCDALGVYSGFTANSPDGRVAADAAGWGRKGSAQARRRPLAQAARADRTAGAGCLPRRGQPMAPSSCAEFS